MNFHQFINILWARKSIALSVLMMTSIITLAVNLLLPRQYVATTSIVVDQRSIDPMTGLSLPLQQQPGYMATQVDVITSHNVARKVVEKLKLSENPQMQKDFAEAESSADIRDWAADLLLKKSLEIRPSRESSLIQVDFTSTDPEFAAIAANAFSDAYIQTSIELHAQPAKLNADWFDSQMASLRGRLEREQSILSNYQQLHGIVATDDRLDLENSRLAELSRQLVESQVNTSELQSRKDLLTTNFAAGGSSKSLQEVLNSSLIQSLKTELARAEARFAELSKGVAINHPQYKQAKAEVDSLQQKIQSEIKMILSSIASGLSSSSQRNKLLADALAEQKAKVLELKKQRNEIAVFNREVENAQRAYDSAMQRAIQTRMESEMNQTNISILNSALPPAKSAKPKVLLNIVLSIFLGSMLGVCLALWAEVMDRRVRSAFDISERLAVPVLAVVSSSASKSKQIPQLFNRDNTSGDSNNQAREIIKTAKSATIGALLLNEGKISASDIERILVLKKQKGLRFGEAAKALGLINDDDIQKALSRQFDFPFLTSGEESFSRELIAAYQPFSAQVEALRAVRGQLILGWFIDVHKTLAVVSSCGEGRSYMTANLAIVFSQLGERTLLIDADLRHPRQHELFKLQDDYGLADVLAERTDLKVITRIPAFRDLSILPAGTIPPNPAELISRGLKNCLQQLQTQFDVILIDTPSAEQAIDVQIIASLCGGVLLLARQNKTRLNDLQHLKEALQNTESQCLGAVLTDLTP